MQCIVYITVCMNTACQKDKNLDNLIRKNAYLLTLDLLQSSYKNINIREWKVHNNQIPAETLIIHHVNQMIVS